MSKVALITGITGQDGAYLARLLLSKDYKVFGMVRRSSSPACERLIKLGVFTHPKLSFVQGDITDSTSLVRIVRETRPDEVYNLAAQSFVGVSWQQPLYTAQATGMGAINLLEATRLERPQARYYQASSSEMFGNAGGFEAQNEFTPFKPCSPYAVAKVFAHHATVNYRNSFNMHASCGILFNHESPLRGLEFVTRKITHGVAMIKAGKVNKLVLGNLDAVRDWGHAEDYVCAMWLMLQRDKPDDYVIATGRSTSVREFVDFAFNYVGLSASEYVQQDAALMRPSDVPYLCGDATKAGGDLGWCPHYTVEEMIVEMVDADL